MSVLVSRAKRAFRLSTPPITRSPSSGSSSGCCWSMVTGPTQETATCGSSPFARPNASHLFSTSGSSTFSIKTLFASVFFGGSKSTVCGVHNSKPLVPFSSPPVPTLAVSVFEYTFLLWWNSFWTIAPVIAIGLFDRIVGMWSSAHGNWIRIHQKPRRRHFDGTA